MILKRCPPCPWLVPLAFAPWLSLWSKLILRSSGVTPHCPWLLILTLCPWAQSAIKAGNEILERSPPLHLALPRAFLSFRCPQLLPLAFCPWAKVAIEADLVLFERWCSLPSAFLPSWSFVPWLRSRLRRILRSSSVTSHWTLSPISSLFGVARWDNCCVLRLPSFLEAGHRNTTLMFHNVSIASMWYSMVFHGDPWCSLDVR